MLNVAEKIAEGLAGKDIFSIIISDDWTIKLQLSSLKIISFLVGIVVLIHLVQRRYHSLRLPEFEIDRAELGLGGHKVSFRPNNTDQQIAYSIQTKLSTRKISLPIDTRNDVIIEIYDSWYEFFKVTRELIKDIPISKVHRSSTREIIKLSVDILNEGLRPHLTKWQARFRYWYKNQINSKKDVEPQELQKQFPAYEELMKDMLAVNKRLISYKQKMDELVRR